MRLSLAWITVACAAAPAAHAQSILARRYAIGDSIAYHMVASNFGRRDSIRYSANVGGRVTRDSAGHTVEQLTWSSLIENGKRVPIAPDAPNARQRLTLALGWQAPPDVAHTHPDLIGPVLDLFTFYVDLQMAARLPALAHAGDRAHVPIPINPSWADGRTIVRGEDAIDFELTLEQIDTVRRVATLLVKHVPPSTSRMNMPAAWMEPPVADTPNNWLEVAKLANGRVAARVGKEIFDVRLHVSLADGRILDAALDNPVDVMERECTDLTLTTCGEPIRYRIIRTIALNSLLP